VRDRFLKEAGFTVLRFWNNEVLGNTEGVLTVILQAFSHNPHPNPPPKGRGEFFSNCTDKE
jgi:very-short-patch-repair endonuclease